MIKIFQNIKTAPQLNVSRFILLFYLLASAAFIIA